MMYLRTRIGREDVSKTCLRLVKALKTRLHNILDCLTSVQLDDFVSLEVGDGSLWLVQAGSLVTVNRIGHVANFVYLV